MQKKYSYIFFILICLSLFSLKIDAQETLKPRPSPFAMVTMKYEDTYVKVTYNRPHRRDRIIFGELVPFDKIWRTGANEATELTTTKSLNFGGKLLEAGTYTLFTIPSAEKWTIILNSGLGQWGTRDYNQELDISRFEVPVELIKENYEPFTIEFEQESSTTHLVMMWENSKVSIPIIF